MRNAAKRCRAGAVLALALLGGCTGFNESLTSLTASTMSIVPATVLAFEIADGPDDARATAVRQLLANLTRLGRQKCDPARQAPRELFISADAASQRATIRVRERGSFHIERWIVVETQIVGDGFPNRSKTFELARRSVSLLDEDGGVQALSTRMLEANWREIAPALQDCARLGTAPLNGAIKVFTPSVVGS